MLKGVLSCCGTKCVRVLGIAAEGFAKFTDRGVADRSLSWGGSFVSQV